MAARGRPQERLRSFRKPALNTGANTLLSDNVRARFSSFESFPPLLARPTLVDTFLPTLLHSLPVPLPCGSLHNHRASHYPSILVVLHDDEGRHGLGRWPGLVPLRFLFSGRDVSEFYTFRLESVYWAKLSVVFAIFGVILGVKGKCQ